MIQAQESSAIQSTTLARLRRTGERLAAILWHAVKTRRGLWVGLAAASALGVATAIVKVMFAASGGIILALLRDAGHQVGGGGLWGALGAAAGGAWNWAFPPDPPPTNWSQRPLQPGQHRVFTDDGFVYTYTPNPNSPSGYRITGEGPSSWWNKHDVLFALPTGGGSIATGRLAGPDLGVRRQY